MSKILCLSGWGQKFDSLEFIFSDSVFDPFFMGENRSASLFSGNYPLFNKVEEFFFQIKSQQINPEIAIGWSLGGQLAVRLIEQKIITPKLLILIAPPFQMIKDSRIQAGMSQESYAKFYDNFTKAPNETLKQFAILNSMNDKNASEIARSLDISDKNFEQLKFWLEELKRFSCFDVDFSNMPRTLFFQGAGDVIVHESQAEYFKQRIKNLRLEIFRNCGHAPHLNDVERMRKVILEEISKI